LSFAEMSRILTANTISLFKLPKEGIGDSGTGD